MTHPTFGESCNMERNTHPSFEHTALHKPPPTHLSDACVRDNTLLMKTETKASAPNGNTPVADDRHH